MSTLENPDKQICYLQQCLSSDKKPLGIFLGAGCPMAVRADDESNSPLVPDVAGLTTAVREKLKQDENSGALLAVLDTHFTEDRRENANVEELLSHIRALRAVAGQASVRGLSATDLDRLDDEICRIIHALVDRALPNTESPYHRLSQWADATARDGPLELFTTNYDLLAEQAFEDCRVPYFDGFAGGRKPFFDIRAMEQDTLPPRWARLWKLHGSINWYQDPKRGVLHGAANEPGLKRVIHPSHLKYDQSRRLPYLAMIDRLRAFLKQISSALIIYGYSFRDDHINEVIIQGLQGTQTAIAFALLFGKLENYERAVGLARERPNLTLLARNGAVIGGREARWPQRDSVSLSPDGRLGLRWIAVDPADANGKQSAEFTLGDFAVFGEFLKQLVGRSSQLPEDASAD